MYVCIKLFGSHTFKFCVLCFDFIKIMAVNKGPSHFVMSPLIRFLYPQA